MSLISDFADRIITHYVEQLKISSEFSRLVLYCWFRFVFVFCFLLFVVVVVCLFVCLFVCFFTILLSFLTVLFLPSNLP